jgi:integrase
MTDSLKVEALSCHNLLAPYGWTLTQATNWVVHHVLPRRDLPPVEKLVEQFLSDRSRRLKPKSLPELSSRLRRFGKHFVGRQVHELTVADMRNWMEGLFNRSLSAQSVIHEARKASAFFNWCVKNEFCERNMARLLELPRVIKVHDVVFLSVDESRRLLAAARDLQVLPWMVLGLYCGLRPDEIERQRAEYIHLDDRFIAVLPKVSRYFSQRRFIELDQEEFGLCVEEWLAHSRPQDPIAPRNLKDIRTRLSEMAGIEWTYDVLRHTAATYHYALYHDAARTAAMLGHADTRMLANHYRGLTTQAEAKKFFDLRPLTL